MLEKGKLSEGNRRNYPERLGESEPNETKCANRQRRELTVVFLFQTEAASSARPFPCATLKKRNLHRKEILLNQ